MSQVDRPSAFRHLFGLVVVAGLVWLLAILWSSGLMFLRGTMFRELSVIAYVVAAFGLLTVVERILSAWTKR